MRTTFRNFLKNSLEVMRLKLSAQGFQKYCTKRNERAQVFSFGKQRCREPVLDLPDKGRGCPAAFSRLPSSLLRRTRKNDLRPLWHVAIIAPAGAPLLLIKRPLLQPLIKPPQIGATPCMRGVAGRHTQPRCTYRPAECGNRQSRQRSRRKEVRHDASAVTRPSLMLRRSHPALRSHQAQ